MARSRRRRGQRWTERISFAISLITVASVAIFIGWLMGQYAIQWVTSSPRPLSTDDVARFQERLNETSSEISSSPSSRPPAAGGGRSAPDSEVANATSPSPADVPSQLEPASSVESTVESSAPPTPPGLASPPATPSPPAPALPSSSAPSRSAPDGGATALFRVQVGAFSQREGAQHMVEQLQAAGFEAVIVPGDLFRVQVGAFREEEGARTVVRQLAEEGFEAIITR